MTSLVSRLSSSMDLKSAATGLVLGASLMLLKAKLFPPPPTFSDDDFDSDGFDTDCDEDSPPPSTDPTQWGVRDAPYKLVLCVNKTLKMSSGKQCAQCCHAAVGCYKLATKLYPFGVKCWEMTGCAKVAVKLPSDVDQDEEFEKIRRKCKERGVACYLVEDAGRTQIAAGSRTVVGVGPAPVAVVDEICSEYKLL
jgi:peptidyl-tRNA hydrolase